MKRLWAVLLVAALLCVAAVPTLAASGTEPGKRVRTRIPFTAAKGSEVPLGSVEITWFEDGTAAVNVTGTLSGNQALSFDFTLDRASHTYKTLRRSPANEGTKPIGVSGVTTMATGDQSFNRTLTLTTYDPVWYAAPLARTSLQLWWVTSGGHITWDYNQTSCYPYNPTTFGTHWYNDACSHSQSFTTTQASASTYAHYYNYDGPPVVGSNTAPTFVTHLINVYGSQTGGFTYSYSYPICGEWWWALHTNVSVT